MVGVLTDTDLLRLQVRSPLYLLRNIDRMSVPGDLARYTRDLAGMVEACAGAASTPCDRPAGVENERRPDRAPAA